MFRGIRASWKKQKRAKDLARKLDAVEARYPEYNWERFNEISRFFHDKSMSSLEEQAFLYRLACQAPKNASAIEIGSWIGHSTCILGAALPGEGARLCAIDGFTGMTTTPGEVAYYKKFLRRVSPTASQRELFDAHIARFGLEKRVTAVASDSAKAALVPDGFAPADFLFIDGGHDLEVVRRDVELYVPLVRSGGVVAFHDFSSVCGVPTVVWAEIKRGIFSDLLGINGSLIAFRKA
jgi:predicted O-methyltransferase YrrM